MIDRSSPPNWSVRAATPADLSPIVQFNQFLATETESKTLDPDVLRIGVRRALAEPGERLRYWVADRGDGRVIGMTGITREWSDWRNGWIWWLQSVYVLEEARALGVFRSIYGAIREAALGESDVIGLRLYVEHANERAMATYRAMGLSPGGYEVYEDLWPDRFSRAE